METGAYGVEIGGAIYFAIFITIGAFIGINLLVVVVTTNLEQMMKAEQGQQHQIAFSEVDDRKGNGNNKLPLVHCAVARSEMSGVPQEPFMGGSLANLSERTCDNFCLVLEAIQENLMQYKEIRAELNTIVDEVRSIRFNQEQEEELMQRHLSWNMSLESRSSVDIREMTREQDLITALVNRKRVQLLSFPLLPNQCLPSPATTPLVKVSNFFKVWPASLDSQAPQQSLPIWLDSSFSGRPCPSCRALHTEPSWPSAPSSFLLRGLERLSSCLVADA